MQIQYARGRGWVFTKGTFSLVVNRKLGRETAEKIGAQVGASLTRTKGNGLDGMGRGAIRRLEFGA